MPRSKTPTRRRSTRLRAKAQAGKTTGNDAAASSARSDPHIESNEGLKINTKRKQKRSSSKGKKRKNLARSTPAKDDKATSSSSAPSLSPREETPNSPTALSSVELQTQLARQKGSMNYALLHADRDTLFSHIQLRSESCLRERDAVGATAIHLLCLFNSPAHINIAREIIHTFQHMDLCSDVYEGPLYQGENCLHIATVNKNKDMVDLLLEVCPKQLEQRAVGSFFSPGSACYYGELPLSFAASTNQSDIVEKMLDAGASMIARDSCKGNNALHLAVLQGSISMFDALCAQWERRKEDYRSVYFDPNWKGGACGDGLRQCESISFAGARRAMDLEKDGAEKVSMADVPLWKHLNFDGQSCLDLAAAFGNKEIFVHILEITKKVQWSYGPITCVIYPLDGFDTVMGKRITDKETTCALREIIEHERLDLIALRRVHELVDKKFGAFAKKKFMQRLYMALAYILALFSVAMLPRWDGLGDDKCQAEPVFSRFPELSLANVTRHKLEIFRFVLETFLVVATAMKIRLESREMKRYGIVHHYTRTGAAQFENLTSLVCGLAVLGIAVSRLSCGVLLFRRAEEDAVLAIATIAAWTNLLWFLLGFRSTGPFVIMLQNMIVADMRAFTLISGVFLGAFSIAFNLLSRPYAGTNLRAPFGRQVRDMFAAMLGEFELEKYGENMSHPQLATVLVLTYVMLLSVVLVNMLIAKMGDTYGRISDQAEHRWLLEKARMVLSIEESMSEEERLLDSNTYWINVDGDRYLQVEEVDEKHYTAFE